MSASTDLPAGDDRSVIELARLLEHPAIWRGRSAARRVDTVPTGYAALDACLPGGGWPRTGLIEILVPRFGVGELYLLLPALALLTRRPAARWCVWVTPPLEPYAPALTAHGAALERMLVVRTPAGGSLAGRSVSRTGDSLADRSVAPDWSRGSGDVPSGEILWAFEQTLGSGASDIALAWAARSPRPRGIRRLHLAAERGKTLGVLFRPQRAAEESSAAILRLTVESRPAGARVTFLKSRGGARGSIELSWRLAGVG
jgi:protein ImuA